MSDRFFSYDGTCFDTFPTLEEARASSELAFKTEQAEASEGWSIAVEHICYGELRGHIVKTVDRVWSEGDAGAFTPGVDRYVEYALRAVPEATSDAVGQLHALYYSYIAGLTNASSAADAVAAVRKQDEELTLALAQASTPISPEDGH